MTAKTLVLMAKVFVVCFFIAACKGGNAGEEVSGTDEDSTALRLAVLPTLDCLPYYVAEAEGIYDSLGLNIRTETFGAAMDADTAFCRGKADVIASDLVKACIWRSQGDSVKIIMSGEIKLYLMTAFSARIRQTSSLKEKIIGITRHSCVDLFTDKVLEGAKFISTDLNKPQINNLTLRCLMVDQNQYDGAMLPEPYASEAEARGARRVVGSDDYLLNLSAVVAHDSIIKQNRMLPQLLRKGYDIAVERINSRIEEYTNAKQNTTVNEDLTAPQLMKYFPKEMVVEVPDSLVRYQLMKKASMPEEDEFKTVTQWCTGRQLLKKEITREELLIK